MFSPDISGVILITSLQKSQVTSLFGAEVLWSKGYTGAKVKMAIFDTGIRANHPHFRNIKVSILGQDIGYVCIIGISFSYPSYGFFFVTNTY